MGRHHMHVQFVYTVHMYIYILVNPGSFSTKTINDYLYSLFPLKGNLSENPSVNGRFNIWIEPPKTPLQVNNCNFNCS